MRSNRIGGGAAALAALALAAGAGAQSVWYVDDDAPGGAGGSWGDAFSGVAAALAVAVPGDEVWVAQGVYTPGALTTDSFAVPAGVLVEGGYAGIGAPIPDLRDPGSQVTTLSGDLGGSNSRHVVRIADGTGVVIDGFVVSGGVASGDVGAGIRVDGGAPTIVGCTIAFNSAPGGFGGAVYSATGLTLDSCVVSNNDAVRGGGLYLAGSATVTNCLFTMNTGTLGGAIHRAGTSVVAIGQSEFTDNDAAEGGAILFFSTAAGPTVEDSAFYGNTAGFGGGVGNLSAGMSMARCIFKGNTGTLAGGGMTTNAGGATVTNCTFEGNTSPVGGGISLTASNSNPDIRNCILWNNNGGSAEADQLAKYFPGGTDPVLNYSCVQGLTGVYGGEGNIDLDPQFTDTVNNDFSLMAGSPCIDTGDPNPIYNDLDGSRSDMGAVAQQNARPTAVVVCEQLTSIGQTAEVRLDGSGSSDPDDITDDLLFDWYVDGGLVSSGLGDDYAVVEVSLGYGSHDVALVVTDPDGAYDDDIKTITVSAAALSLLEMGKTVVDFKDGPPGQGTFSINGEVGLPYGLDYTEVARVADVWVSVAGATVAGAEVALSHGCGDWRFSSHGGVGGLTRVTIDWNGAKFEYKDHALSMRSEVITSDETVLTVKYNMKKIGGAFALTIDGAATLTVNAQGVASADVPMCVDHHGKEVTLTMPFPITDSSTILIFGPPYALIDAGDYLTASIGRYRIEGKFDATAFPAKELTTPRTVEVSISLGDEGYAGAAMVGAADLAVKKDRWQAK